MNAKQISSVGRISGVQIFIYSLLTQGILGTDKLALTNGSYGTPVVQVKQLTVKK